MKNRENAFDFLRLFAAFSVIVGHATVYFNTNFLWLEPGGGLWFYDRVPHKFSSTNFWHYKCLLTLGASALLKGDPIEMITRDLLALATHNTSLYEDAVDVYGKHLFGYPTTIRG